VVLVAGGVGLASAELYDPVAGKFAATGDLTDARSGHTATLLGTGMVLVAGGHGGGVAASASDGGVLDAGEISADVGTLASAELYDPNAGKFKAIGSMTTVREDHTATSLPSGMVLLVGGHDSGQESIGSAELYDPNAGKFAAASSMTARRYGHSATSLPSGSVLIAGGWTDARADLASAELYR
jgi:hypothetical protein